MMSLRGLKELAEELFFGTERPLLPRLVCRWPAGSAFAKSQRLEIKGPKFFRFSDLPLLLSVGVV